MMRMNSYGVNAKEAHINQSKSIIRQQIMNSYNRQDAYLKVDKSELTYCITRDINANIERKFVFIPDAKVRMGEYVTIDDKTYLLTKQDTNEVTPEFTGLFCTAFFHVRSEDREELIGFDDLDRPVYDIIPGEVLKLPCVVKMNDASTAIAGTNEPVNTLDNQIKISITYTESKSIQHNERFVMYGDVYRIIRIDPSDSINGVGVLHITGERVTTDGGGI